MGKFLQIYPLFCESIEDMAPEDRDDEMELINAEFESMVADLNLDQSSPRTYLDDLDDLERQESHERDIAPRVRRGMHGTFRYLLESIKKWWQKDDNEGDGAVV